jgi:hypothetical protein
MVEKSKEKRPLTENIFTHTRGEVLEKLWNIAKWHEDKRINPRAKLDGNTKARSSLASKEIRAYQAILQGLTDQELELRIKALEEKLQNSILIPKTEEKKRN